MRRPCTHREHTPYSLPPQVYDLEAGSLLPDVPVRQRVGGALGTWAGQPPLLTRL